MKTKTTKNFDFHSAWEFIKNHPNFQSEDGKTRIHTIWIDIVKINPVLKKICKLNFLNTKVEFWLEYGPSNYDEDLKEWVNYLDDDLQASGDTFEEAIINLAYLIEKKYGLY
jgi:hypothetical protein